MALQSYTDLSNLLYHQHGVPRSVWSKLFQKIMDEGVVNVDERQAAVLRTLFLRWRRKSADRANFAITRKKVGADRYDVRIIETDSLDDAKVINARRWTKLLSRRKEREAQIAKERKVARRINTAKYQIPGNVWNDFFHAVQDIEGFQIATDKVEMVVGKFALWVKLDPARNGLRLMTDCAYPDGYVRFYVSAVEASND